MFLCIVCLVSQDQVVTSFKHNVARRAHPRSTLHIRGVYIILLYSYSYYYHYYHYYNYYYYYSKHLYGDLDKNN